VSHKGLRLLLPVLHAALLVATLGLADDSFYGGALVAQACFYYAAFTGHVLRQAARRPLLISVPYAMCLMLWATVAAFHRFATDRQQVTWEQAAAFDLPRRTRQV
jgi:hypothetical protein